LHTILRLYRITREHLPKLLPAVLARRTVRVPVLNVEASLNSKRRARSEEVVPLVEETASIATRGVVTGRVRVRTVTDTVEELTQTHVEHSAVEVTRVPIDRVIEAAPEIRTEGDLTIVPVVEEVLVIEKRLVLREELHIRRTSRTEAVEVPVTLRKQRAVVERLAPDDQPNDEEIPK
jgi:stress response protein YsnF